MAFAGRERQCATPWAEKPCGLVVGQWAVALEWVSADFWTQQKDCSRCIWVALTYHVGRSGKSTEGKAGQKHHGSWYLVRVSIKLQELSPFKCLASSLEELESDLYKTRSF